MKKIMIDGKEYTMEFTIGASLYDECVVSITKLLASAFLSDSEDSDKEKVNDMLSVMGGVPKVAMTAFYAGLMEHHGVGEYAGDDSDGSVPDIKTARKLITIYLKENKEYGNGSFMDVLNLCVECMGDDDFLTLIGVDKMIEMGTPTTDTQQTSKKRGRPKKIEAIQK